VQLWFSKPASGERPKSVTEATLESLGVTVKVEGQRIRMFDKDGNEILPLREKIALLQRALEEERAKREELERKLRQQS
jgi:predicted RNase H-like nuclease (RuvC/YqgF family)